jgi:ribonuclease HI
MKPLNIYTDGACSGNQNQENIGGWGAVLEYGEAQKELYGGQQNTTNNRMEMTALLAALKVITKENQYIRVFSDSAYLMDCFRKKWYLEWQSNGWRTKAKKPVENKDLWEPLLSYLTRHRMDFYRVKGHVSLRQEEQLLQKGYQQFLEWNGADFTYEDFLYVTKKNHRADELANLGIYEIREGDSPLHGQGGTHL